MRWATALGVGVVLLAGGSLVARAALTRQLADVFERKLVAVQTRAGAGGEAPLTTVIAEDEVNSYLRFKSADQLPVGLTEPAFTLLGGQRFTARAVVDLDLVRQKRGTGSWFDPTSYLAGKMPVSATGVLKTAEGRARFELERAEMSGVAVPKSLLQQILTYFTRSADRPGGAGLDDTYKMPAEIQRLKVERGRAVVIQ